MEQAVLGFCEGGLASGDIEEAAWLEAVPMLGVCGRRLASGCDVGESADSVYG